MGIKGEQKSYKLQQYEVLINPISEKKITIQVIDPNLKIQFAEQQLLLDKIGLSTLLVALEGIRKEISVSPIYKKEGQIQFLELKIKIQSAFLKTIQESIYIKKFRDVDDFQILDKKLKTVGQKLRRIKEENADQGNTFYTFKPQAQSFTGASYEPLSSIKLKKGKYLITFSFNLKANNQWLYIYANAGQQVMSNSGFYVPNTSQLMPFTVRIIKVISEEEKQFQFTTSSASSYPVTLSNRIITAQRIPN